MSKLAQGWSLCFLRRLFGFATVLLAITASSPADAKRVALVVGISDYDFSPRLTNPGRDAAGMSAALKSSGFEVVQALDPSMASLLQALDKFYAIADGAEAAVFFFAGHGLQFDGINYLVPKDAQLRSETRLKQETVALQDVIVAIEKRASMALVFLDACRDNPLAEQLQRSAKGASRTAGVSRGLAPMSIRNPDTLLVFAAAPGKTASDGTGLNSPFTTSLLRNMAEPGVEVELMLKRVTRDVVQSTKGAQVPERLSRLTTEFVFKNASHSGDETTKPVDALLPPARVKTASPVVRPQVAVQQRDSEARPLLPQGCTAIGTQAALPIDVSVGSTICAADGSNRARITRITEASIGYAAGDRLDRCAIGEQCTFNWIGAPKFKVVIKSGETTARLMPW